MAIKKMKQYSNEEIEVMYKQLRINADHPEKAHKPQPPAGPRKWTPSDFQVAVGYATRVAKNVNLNEFGDFIRSGELPRPIKMSKAELELLQGGTWQEWVLMGEGVGAAVGGAAVFCI